LDDKIAHTWPPVVFGDLFSGFCDAGVASGDGIMKK
jgi:hypothetical protein